MSRYPEADEAQHRHYNDGYLPYPARITPDPYDSQPNTYDRPLQPQIPYPPLQDLFNIPHSPLSSPPPPPVLHPPQAPPVIDPGYGAHCAPSVCPVSSPPPPPNQTGGGSLNPSSQSLHRPSGFNESRLLRRDPSSSISSIPRVPEFDDDGDGAATADNQSENNIRYGRIPQRVPRRYKTIKKVELFHGNFVLDNAIPKKLLDMCANRTEREFTHMRYSAATCDANDFKDQGFTLRQVHYDPPRRTELFIVITMYNEDEAFFCRTMHGVIKNVAHLCKRDRSKTWGKDGWKKVVVCIVSDGRGQINSRTLSVIAAMGAYQEGVAKTKIGKKDVTAHIYEYTTQISVTPNLKIEGAEKGAVPVQVIFCLKEKNQKKINSHRWFFNAFGPILQPNVCVLIDVGTMPGPESIYHLWKTFDINSSVGGACGELVAPMGKYGVNLRNPLVAAQNFEYKMSNILDRSLESVFGYVTVLAGAFSAYRYIALQNDPTGEGPLQKYFLGESMHGAGADIFTANMYLAEDRILCWELVSKRGGSWVLHYVKSACAVTDVPAQVPELLSQRRRWINGTFFATVHSTVHFHYLYRSSHSFLRKAWIHVELVYQLYDLIFSWFSLANYYLTFAILTKSLEDLLLNLKGIDIVNDILNYSYLGLFVMCLVLSLGNRPQGSKWGYVGVMIGFSIITIYVTGAAYFLAVKGIEKLAKLHGPLAFSDIFTNAIFRTIVIPLLSTLGLYIIASVVCFEPWHMITSLVQYILMLPSHTNVLKVYAFANVHDVSWGTKGDNTVAQDLGTVSVGNSGSSGQVEAQVPADDKDINALYEDAIYVLNTKTPKLESKLDASLQQRDFYRSFRTNVLLVWIITNGLLGAVILSLNRKASVSGAKVLNWYTVFCMWSVAGLAFVRFVGSLLYLICRVFAGE